MKAYKSCVVFAGLLCVFMVSGCSREHSEKDGRKPVKQEVTMRIRDRVWTLDNDGVIDPNSRQIMGNVYEGLYRYDRNNHLKLAGAESVKSENGGRTLTFRLRRNAKWSNGDPVTAGDYVYAWREMVNPKTGAPHGADLMMLKNAEAIRHGRMELDQLGVRALDDYTLRVELNSETPYFKEVLASLVALPKNRKVAEAQKDKYGTSSETAVFNGPFRPVGLSRTSDKWKLVRNDGYWDRKSVRLKTVRYVVVKSQAKAAQGVRDGKYDYARIGAMYSRKLERSRMFHSCLIPEITTVCFNSHRKVTGNVHFRRAVTYGIDRQKVAGIPNLHARLLYGLVPQGYSYNPQNDVDFRADAGNILKYDRSLALKEWNEAKRETGLQNVTLTMLVTDRVSRFRQAEVIRSSLEKTLPGLKIRISQVSTGENLKRAVDYDYDLLYQSWQPFFVDPLAFLLDGGMEHLRDDYHNTDFWNCIYDATVRYAADFNTRRRRLIEAEDIMIGQDAFVAPVCQLRNGYMLNPKVRDVSFDSCSSCYNLRNAWVAGK